MNKKMKEIKLHLFIQSAGNLTSIS